MRKLIWLIPVWLVVSGCSTKAGSPYGVLYLSSQGYVRSVRPLDCEDGLLCFEYHFRADVDSRADDPDAERVRLRWMRHSVDSNGCDVTGMEVTERQAVLREKTVLGVKVHDLYYTVRAPKLE